MRVLIIEDDAMIGQALVNALKAASYAVDWLREGTVVEQTIMTQSYDLLLLDIGLPGTSGLEILKSIRNTGNQIPTLIITAREELDDRIAGLDEGADDYLIKPFKIPELLARMRAVLRRKSGIANPTLSNGIIALDIAKHEASVNQLPSVLLSSKEFALLEALMIRPGSILSRSQLEDRIYGWGDEVESNAIEFLIHAIRKKLGNDSIKNVRGAGWMVSKDI